MERSFSHVKRDISHARPVAFAVGPFVVRWYGIAYVAGFVCAALVLWQVAKRWKVRVDADSLLTVVLCAIVGVILEDV